MHAHSPRRSKNWRPASAAEFREGLRSNVANKRMHPVLFSLRTTACRTGSSQHSQRSFAKNSWTFKQSPCPAPYRCGTANRAAELPVVEFLGSTRLQLRSPIEHIHVVPLILGSRHGSYERLRWLSRVSLSWGEISTGKTFRPWGELENSIRANSRVFTTSRGPPVPACEIATGLQPKLRNSVSLPRRRSSGRYRAELRQPA